MKSAKNISVIITAHNEGLFLHKTILSVKNSLKNIGNYEIILSLDSSDDETKKIAEIWGDDNDIRIFEVNFKNPSDNRNHAIKNSNGKFIMIIDGDDLISENFIEKSLKILQKNPNSVIRPEIHLQFENYGENLKMWKMRNSNTKEIDAIQMSYWNLWTNCLIAKKEILLDTPFKNPEKGFGFEDYLFNSELISKGIQNIIAKETVLFYRKRQNSTSEKHINATLEYSPLFEIDFIKSINLPEGQNPKNNHKNNVKSSMKKIAILSFKILKKNNYIREKITPFAVNAAYKNNIKSKVPAWLIEEIKRINKIENQLWPTEIAVAKMDFHPLTFQPFDLNLGIKYKNLCENLSNKKLDYAFLIDELSGIGGTEKLIKNYIIAILKSHPEWNIAIISSENTNKNVTNFFKDLKVDIVKFGEITKNLGEYEKNILLSRFIIQSKVKRFHIVNSKYWYKWVKNNESLLKNNNFTINASLFMKEFTHEKNRILTFADPYISDIFPLINTIFTDNKKVIYEAMENNAFDKNRLKVHYQPENISEIKKYKPHKKDNRFKILWASRISFQKRPDILKKISSMLGSEFEIDAYGIIEKNQYKPSFFNDSKINYRGGFKGLSSINTSNYDLFLYTSETDGLPNILIEAIKEGLPIVSSNIGGIPEIIENDISGKLVDLENIEKYVEAINYIKNNPNEAAKFVEKAQEKIQKQHSWEEFIKKVAEDIK